MTKYINTELFSQQLRKGAIDLVNKRILITKFHNTQQAGDLTDPPNCDGYGRKRHFKLDVGNDWLSNPLPIFPAAKALKLKFNNAITAQVFQNSICNWRCWYCFVDDILLSGSKKHADLLSSNELLDLYLREKEKPAIIDLTGGQPDLTPEWVFWMMEALKERNLDKSVFLWSDDNLSNDYFWRYLNDTQIAEMIEYKMYSRVCCFKGIDENSFTLNTKADPRLYEQQFNLFRRLLKTGFDLYSYITLTASTNSDFGTIIPAFLDRIQEIHEMLPLRMIPLKVLPFTPLKHRLNAIYEDMLEGQFYAVEIWKKELEDRFSSEQREISITEIVLN